MKYDKLDSNNFTEHQKIILLMKTIGLIKDKSEQIQSRIEKGKFSFE